MSPKNKKKLEAAINNLFSAPVAPVLPVQPEKANGHSNGTARTEQPAALQIQQSEPTVVAPPPAEEAKPAAPAPAPDPGDSLSGMERNGPDGLQMVIFTLQGEYYGIDIAAVESIIKMQTITKLPHVPRYVTGLTNLRGKVLPVFSLRRRFGLPDYAEDKDTRIIIIRLERGEAGLLVDAVSEVNTIARESIEPAPTVTISNTNRYIQGIAHLEDRLVILPDLNRVIESAA